jgi:chaperonin GroEL
VERRANSGGQARLWQWDGIPAPARSVGGPDRIRQPFRMSPMNEKKLLFRSEAREKILHGTGALAEAVRVTLGPRSRAVLIERKWGRPLVCNDGVTIAREFALPDPEENLGAQVLKEAAERTGDLVGDGTTTAILLAHAIYAEGVRNVAAGAGAVELKRGIDRGMRAAIESIRAQSKPVETRKEKVQVATIAAHNDPAMGELVADAVDRVGPEGVITLEEAKGTDTSLEVVEGMRFDRGYLSPYFVTDPERMEAVLEAPLILLYSERITHMKDLLPLLEEIAKSGRALLIVAEDVGGEALATLAVNKLRGILASAAVKAPGFGDRRKELLEDLATLTGGKAFREELGVRLDKVTTSDLGNATRVLVGRDSTAIIGGAGRKEAIEGRCRELRRQMEEASSEYDRDKLQERLAKLSGGVAVIHVGAPSETELKSRKEAFEDAVSATQAAVEEGIVPGAGLALLRALEAVEREADGAEGDERTGILVLKRALEVPTRQIAENSAVDGGVVVDRMRSGSGAWGFDAARREWVDLHEAGIVDPTKVVRIAIENAVSVAGVLLLTEATMTEVPAKEASEPLEV